MDAFDWVSLDSDEEVLWSGEPKMNSIYPSLGIGVLFIPLFGIGFLIIAGSYLHLKNTDFLVSSKALYKKTGVLSRSVQRIKFGKVQNISYSQSLFGKVFDYGSIEISTAGGSGIEMRFNAVENPREIQDLINSHIEKEEQKGREPESSSD